jgi:hypothetical protein
MKYLGGSFSIIMPGGATPWPFDAEREQDLNSTHWYLTCPVCEAQVFVNTRRRYPAHTDARDAGRPRKRVCFWK